MSGLPLAAASERMRGRPGRPRKPIAEPAGNSAPPILPRLLDLKGTAQYLSVSEWSVRDLEAAGVLPRVRIPLPRGGQLRKVLFDRQDLDVAIARWKERRAEGER